MASLISLHFWLHSQDMKIFLSHLTTVNSIDKLGPSNLHPLVYQPDGYLSAVNLSQGQVWRFLLIVLIWTFLASASAPGTAGNQLGMHNPVSYKYTTHQVGISTSSSYNYLHCFERWVGPDCLLPFQVSVDMFVLVYRVELLRFAPLLGQAKFWFKIPKLHPGTPRHLLILPFIPTQWTCSTDHLIIQSVQNPTILLFTPQ